jgi:hypothetical protein
LDLHLTLQERIERLRELELEAQDRRGYTARPQREEEFRDWEDAAAWPEDWAAAIFTSDDERVCPVEMTIQPLPTVAAQKLAQQALAGP